MRPLRYPLLPSAVGFLAGWAACVAAKAIFRLPDGLLGVLLFALGVCIKSFTGDNQTTRGIADLS